MYRIESLVVLTLAIAAVLPAVGARDARDAARPGGDCGGRSCAAVPRSGLRRRGRPGRGLERSAAGVVDVLYATAGAAEPARRRVGTRNRGRRGRVARRGDDLDVQRPAGLEHPSPEGSFWAPDCIRDDAGRYHLFVTFVPGPASTHRDYGGERHIVHYSSDDLCKWKFDGRVPVSSDYCIDPTLCRRADGEWWMWFKDERHD